MVKRESERYAHKRSYIERLAAGDADQPYFSVEVETLPLRIARVLDASKSAPSLLHLPTEVASRAVDCGWIPL